MGFGVNGYFFLDLGFLVVKGCFQFFFQVRGVYFLSICWELGFGFDRDFI